MSCAGCTIADGNPKGCKTNGGCSSGGCNRMNTYDWLSDISIADDSTLNPYVEVSFKNGARKAFYKNINNVIIDKGECVAVESEMGGYDVGTVSLTGEMARLQMKRKKVSEQADKWNKILRIANENDINKLHEARALETETMVRARAIAHELKLNMKVGDVEYQGDGRKAIFYYIADDRVDFRELIKVYAKDFKVKIEMCHIGARQEAARIGGIGSCGRELCCSTWLTDFKAVTTGAARYQNLSINQVKLSGQCGRLKCCLNYELDTYLDALQDIPQNIEKLETEGGEAFLQKTDIFKKIMWFTYRGSTTYHPLTIDRVKEIEKLNKQGIKPQDLGALVIQKHATKEEKEPEFVDVVGQTTLSSLGSNKKKKNKNKNKNKSRDNSNPNQKAQQPPSSSNTTDNAAKQTIKPEQKSAQPNNLNKPTANPNPNRNQGKKRFNKPNNNSNKKGNNPPTKQSFPGTSSPDIKP
jgi:cell fate regulator YaaT (PSP1 superfamily)